MYKPLSDNTLMTMTKKEIIEHLRIAEYNYGVCLEQIDQQYKNFIKLLSDEQANTIEECKEILRQHWLHGTVAYRIIDEINESLEQLKEHK